MAPALLQDADTLPARLRTERNTDNPLSPREREVLAHLATGWTNRQIATQLVLSERTIETHVAYVLAKLGVANRAEAAVWATRHGK